jgi:hypothetical protein
MGHEHLICAAGRKPRAWDPQAPPARADFAYLGELLATFERALPDPPLTIVVTTDHRELPRYGRDVVVIQRGGPVAHVPRYADRVLALLKTHAVRPGLAARPLREPVALTLVALLSHAQECARALPGQARRLASSSRVPVEPIPMGYMWPPAIDFPPAGERPVDLLFNGSVLTVEHEGLRRRIGTPKTRSRDAMLRAAHALERARPDIAVDLAVTPSFAASKHDGAAPYWQRLARAKICLAPRGDTLETYRLFEAARAGCVVVAERLPSNWLYDGAPVIDQTGWRGLAACVEGLLADPPTLAERQRRTISWWTDVASPAAVGRRMAGWVRSALAQT